MMYECLPGAWREWVAGPPRPGCPTPTTTCCGWSNSTGLPDPDHYLLRLVQLDRQAQDLNRAQLWSRPAAERVL